MDCECHQDTTSELSSSDSRLLATLRTSSSSSLLESNEAVPLADSSTMSADLAPTPEEHSRESRSTTGNRLLVQLLAGSSLSDDGDFSGIDTASHGALVTSVATNQSISGMMQSSQSVRAMMQEGWSTAGNELSEDLNGVNVTDLFNAVDLQPVHQSGTISKTEVEDQLLMAQLEQAIMNSELSLEDLDHLLAMGSSSNTTPVTASSAITSTGCTVTDRQLMHQCHSALLGMS